MKTTLDPSTRALLAPGQRRGPTTIAALAGTTGLVVAVVLLLGVRAVWPSGQDPSSPSGAVEATPMATATPPEATRGGPLLLPQPTGTVDGVLTGFPATPAGAVAAAYAYSRVATSLDAAATLRALEQIADPATRWLTTERTAIADGVAAQRSALGLAPIGPSDGATLVISPAGFQFVGRPDARSATVLTLAVLSGTAVDGTRTSASRS